MTLHKLTAGDGYLYLMRHVAKADADPATRPGVPPAAGTARTPDAAAYYTAHGNPPGVWLGKGAIVLGLAGSTVTETQMRNLFGVGAHPDADTLLTDYLREHTRPGMTERQHQALTAAAQRHAQLGRRFAEYKPLPPLAQRVAARVDALQAETGRPATTEEVARIRAAESRRAAGAVAGFDLVFSPVKSLALLWALDERAHVRDAIRHAHEQAMTETLTFLETNAAHTRTGADGLAQIDTTGLVAVAFTHYDSRAGDPNLHTHVAVSNKIQGVDGVWRALDARGLHALAVTASEHYNTRVQTHVSDRLAVTFEARHTGRGTRPVMEIAGIDQQIIEHFSRRRAQLEARYDQLLADYRTTHGRDPDFAAARALADRANLETRAAKHAPRSLADMRDTWRQDLHAAFGPTALRQLENAVPAHPRTSEHLNPDLVPGSVEHAAVVNRLAAAVLEVVQGSRSTWSVWNLRAEAERALRHPDVLAEHHLTAATASQLTSLAEAVTERAAGPGMSLRLDPPDLAPVPASLRRADGTSVFTRHGADRYTSQRVLDAEQRLLTAATTAPALPIPGPSRADVERILAARAARNDLQLDAGQVAVVTAFAADPRTIVVGLGPAGTGKTTAMRALRDVLDQGRRDRTGTGRLVPLATSAHAADVLSQDLGIRAENVHKFLHDTAVDSPHRIRLHVGDVVLVDEAGMAGTPNLDRLLTLVQGAGARLRLLGDDRQLAAVESGGALRLLAEEAGAVELDVVHRFTDPGEAAATLQLRTGDHRSLGYYQAHQRVHGGSLQDMTDSAYTAWLADVHAGKTSVLATTTTLDVTRLAARARVDRVTAGQVEPEGVTLHDANTAGVGDWIVTRHNDRRLTTPDRRAWVRNGDPWRVVHRRRDGALTVQHLRDGARLVLPPSYVTRHVELLYATTAHRVQGATVDTAHALITPDAAREHLYVLATRARHATHLYVQTHAVLPVDEDERVDRRSWDPAGIDATVILQRILDREAAEPSATQALRDAQTAATSLATLVPRYQHAIAHLTAGHYLAVLREQLTEADFAEVQRDDACANLITELRRAHQAGWQPERALAQAVRDARALATTDHDQTDQDPADETSPARGRSLTRLISEQLRGLAASLNPPVHLHQPTDADLDRYADLLAHHGIPLGGVSIDCALQTPALLRAGAFDDPVPGYPRRNITASSCRHEVAGAFSPSAARRILPGNHQEQDNPAHWRTLQTVLQRAQTAGHDLDTLLSSPAVRTTLPEHGPAALHLADAITRLLADHPTPALIGIDARGRTGTTYAWNHLAWALKAAEDRGTDPAELLPAAGADTSLDQGWRHSPPIVAAWLHLQTHASTPRLPGDPVLPWAPDAVPGTVTDPAETTYLHDLKGLIADRVTALRREIESTVLAGNPPPWARSIVTPFARYEHSRPAWLDQVQVIAAFREQYPAAASDPAQSDPAQPLGPHPEPTPHTDPTHARAHAAAAHALAHAFHRAHPHGAAHRRADASDPREDARVAETRRQLTSAVWSALDLPQKTAVAAVLLARIGALPTPTTNTVVPAPAGAESRAAAGSSTVSGLDEAVTHPGFADDLHRILVEQGHLTDLDPPQRRRPVGSATRRRNGGADVKADTVRDRRPTGGRRAEPAHPAPDQQPRYDPQPGRPEPRPGRQHRL